MTAKHETTGYAAEDELFFADSWTRLRWVEHLAARIENAARPWALAGEHAEFLVKIGEYLPQHGLVEFEVSVPAVEPLPEEIHFLVGDLATNARSCLDMAMTDIGRHYELDGKAQFPLEDDFSGAMHSSRKRILRRYLERLPHEVARVIEASQADYVEGLIDIPMNLSALAVAYLSNANKHRNITPVHVQTRVSSFGGTTHASLRLVDGQAVFRPPFRFVVDYDSEKYTSSDIATMVRGISYRSAPLNIDIRRKLIVTGQDIPFRLAGGAAVLPRPLELREVTAIPGYVRSVLRALESAIRRS